MNMFKLCDRLSAASMMTCGTLATIGFFGLLLVAPICGVVFKLQATGYIVVASIFMIVAAVPFALLGLFMMAIAYSLE